MSFPVDTSVWSLALRRDAEASEPEVQVLKDALFGTEVVVTTGLILQELLQGVVGVIGWLSIWGGVFFSLP
jgi:hypothetical protein